MRKKSKKLEEKPLTLSALISYNEKVLLPSIDKRFEIQDRKIENNSKRMDGLEQRMDKIEIKLEKYREDMMLSFDHVFKKLDILIGEKEVQDYQHGKEKRLWRIMVDSLDRNKLLTKKQQKEIKGLEVI